MDENIQHLFFYRKQLLFDSASQEIIEQLIKLKIFEGIDEIIINCKNLNLENKQFCFNYLITATKCYEGFCKNYQGLPRFPDLDQKELFQTILWNTELIRFVFTNTIEFYQLDNEKLISNAKANIKSNFEIVQQIVGPITQEKLDIFLSEQKIIVFKNGPQACIQGIPSYNGKKVYLNDLSVKDLKQYTFNEQIQKRDNSFCSDDQEYLENYYFRAILTIESLIVENLSKWLCKGLNPLNISPEKNQNLRLQGNKMVGSAKYYLKIVYNKKFRDFNPFEFNQPKLQSYDIL